MKSSRMLRFTREREREREREILVILVSEQLDTQFLL